MTRILVFGVSTREGSYNRALAHSIAALLAADSEVTVDRAEFAEFKSPLYDGDHSDSTQLPEGAKELARRIGLADGLIVAAPEYNGGICAMLKNSIDWVSLLRPIPFQGKPVLLLSASPGRFGGIRGLWHSRVPFEAIGAHVFPEMLALPNSHQAFNAEGGLARSEDQKRIRALLDSFLNYARALK